MFLKAVDRQNLTTQDLNAVGSLSSKHENNAIPVAQHAFPVEKIALKFTRASQSYTHPGKLATSFSPLEAARRNAITIGSRNDSASPALLHSSNFKMESVGNRSFLPFSTCLKWIFGISALNNPNQVRI